MNRRIQIKKSLEAKKRLNEIIKFYTDRGHSKNKACGYIANHLEYWKPTTFKVVSTSQNLEEKPMSKELI